MLRFISQYQDVPVMSIRGGREIAKLGEPILNPHKLRVEAFYCDVRVQTGGDLVLFPEDIREFGPYGIIVDSEDSLIEVNELVRLEKILKINFQLHEKQVITDHKRKLGKVDNYTVDDTSFLVERLYVKPSALMSLKTGDLIIARKQILSVNENEVIVKDTVVKGRSGVKRPSFNPLAS